jgi:hypothetical protein
MKNTTHTLIFKSNNELKELHFVNLPRDIYYRKIFCSINQKDIMYLRYTIGKKTKVITNYNKITKIINEICENVWKSISFTQSHNYENKKFMEKQNGI